MAPSKRSVDGSESLTKRLRPAYGASTTSSKLAFLCHLCATPFTVVGNLMRHMKTVHGTQKYTCYACDKSFNRSSSWIRHGRTHETQPSLQATKYRAESSTNESAVEDPAKFSHIESSNGSALRVGLNVTDENQTHCKKREPNEFALACDVCGKMFSRKDNFIRHRKVHSMGKFFCQTCNKMFSDESNMLRHRRKHNSQTCRKCGQTFPSGLSLSHHLKYGKVNTVGLSTAGDPSTSLDPRNPTSSACPPSGCKTALNGSYERHRARGSDIDVDLFAFLQSQPHKELIMDALQRMKGVKFFVSANILMVRPKNWITRGDQESRPYFTSRCHRVLEGSSIDELLDRAYGKIVDNMIQYLREGSGWIIGYVNFVDLVLSKYKPMTASSYIPLPPEIAHAGNTVVNVKNNDEKCFLWAVLSALHPVQRNPQRLIHYLPFENSLDFGDLSFPMSPDDISAFEELNCIHVNLFGFWQGEVFPIYISDTTSKINLLLISDGINQHFCWVRNFNMFMDLVSSSEVFVTDDDEIEDSRPMLNWR